MTRAEAPTLTSDLPDLPSRGVYDPDAEDLSTLTFSPEEDSKLDKASQWGRSLILAARAGDAQALSDLQQRMHITRWDGARDGKL